MASIEKREGRRRAGGSLTPASYRVQYRDPRGRMRSKSFPRQKEAERFRSTVETDKLRGTWVDPTLGKETFTAQAERFMRQKVNLKPKTRASYAWLLEKHLKPRFGDLALARIETSDVKEWVAELQAAGKGASLIRQAYGLVKQILDAAVTDTPRRLLANPAAGVKLPRAIRKEMRFLTEREVEKLAGALEEIQPGAGLVAYIGAYGGLRIGEMFALRRHRCTGAGELRIEVAESLAEISGELIFGPTKNYQRRTVRIPSFLGELLSAHLAERVLDEPDALLFTTPGGKPMRYTNFKRDLWTDAIEAAEIPGATPHALRHTCAALLIAAGAHPKEIQTHLGHSTISVTMDLYGHLLPDEWGRLTERLETRRAAAREANATARAPEATVVDLAAHQRR